MRRRVKIGKAFDLEVWVDTNPPRLEKREGEKSLPRRVMIGEGFDAKVHFAKEWVTVADGVTRSRMVWATFAMIATFLFGATGLGFYQSEFSALQAVWAVAGPIYGGIASYFFTRHSPK